jgi:YHS domain-containing protein
MKIIIYICLIGLFAFISFFFAVHISSLSNNNIAWSQEEDLDTPPDTEAVEVNNKYCPVCGLEVDEMVHETCEFKGKIYRFCSKKCLERFLDDPDRYIKPQEDKEGNTKNRPWWEFRF